VDLGKIECVQLRDVIIQLSIMLPWRTLMEKTIDTIKRDERKPYHKPEILHELELETRAGTWPPPTLHDNTEDN
jgi:hypothetical protein